MKDRRLPVAQLHEPAAAARTSIDDEQLDSLCASMRDLGLLQPLVVKPRDDGGFEVVAGHRRLLAARRIGLAEVACRVVTDAAALDAIKIHENTEREELSPADEALYYADLLPRLGDDTDALAAAVKKTRDYVERRLLLLRGDQAVFEALRAGLISLGVADELNRMSRAEDREYYLAHATRGGCSVRQARLWREEANTRATLLERAQAAQAAPPSESAPPAASTLPPQDLHAVTAAPWELSSSQEPRPCFFCGEQHAEWRMYRKFICSPCQARWDESQAKEAR